MIYLDNSASTYRKPQVVTEAFKNAITKYAANPGRSGHFLSARGANAVYDCREALAETFGCEPEHVIFTSGATTAINIALKGYLKCGDEVIVSDLEHNAVVRPLKALERHGVKTRVANVSLDDDRVTLQSFKNLISEKTRLIAVTGASNVVGKTLPTAALGKLCRERGIRLLVDGAQSAGYVRHNLKHDNIDFLCLAGHKGLYGPQGIGALLLGEEIFMETVIEGGTGTNSKSPLQPLLLPERLESGTLNMPGIVGLHAAIKYINTPQFAERLASEQELFYYAYDRLKRIGAKLYTPPPRNLGYIPVMSFNLEGKTSSYVAEELSERRICTRPGFHCSGGTHRKLGTLDEGTVRISLSIYNTKDDIDSFIWAVKEIMSQGK